ncbi:MAG: hypothetical protein ACXV4B_08560 [Halobacteriota archaeon]
MAFGKTIESVKDLLAVVGEIVEAAETEIAYLVPASLLGFASQNGLLRAGAKKLIQNGGRVRGLTTLSFYYIDVVRPLLDIGEDVRHVGQSQEVLMLVRDKKESISSINVYKDELLLEDPLVAFWSDDPAYAEYLLSSFDMVWKNSVPAEERIQELLKEGATQT